jgi:hypothetical protein
MTISVPVGGPRLGKADDGLANAVVKAAVSGPPAVGAVVVASGADVAVGVVAAALVAVVAPDWAAVVAVLLLLHAAPMSSIVARPMHGHALASMRRDEWFAVVFIVPPDVVTSVRPIRRPVL